MTAAVQQPQTQFISLRWRFMLPVFLALLVATMIGAYYLGDKLSENAPQTNLLLQNSRAIASRTTELYEQSRLEGQCIELPRREESFRNRRQSP